MKQKTSTIAIIIFVSIIAAAVSGCASAPANTPAAPTVTASAGPVAGITGSSSYNITITGGNTSPVTVTYADLKAMDMVELQNATMVKMNGWLVSSDWVGVPVDEILAKAGVPDGNVTFTMCAPDGFATIYNKDDLKGAILGLKKNGTVLNDDVNGDWPIQIVVPGQIGHMWVKVPVSIQMSTS